MIDAGYDDAVVAAERGGLRVPMRETVAEALDPDIR